MNIDLITDPNLTPHARGDMRILNFNVIPYDDDNTRYRANIELTAFSPADKPNLLLTVVSSSGDELTSANIVESMHRSIGITLHVANTGESSKLVFRVDLYYEDENVQDSAETLIQLDIDPTTNAGQI